MPMQPGAKRKGAPAFPMRRGRRPKGFQGTSLQEEDGYAMELSTVKGLEYATGLSFGDSSIHQDPSFRNYDNDEDPFLDL